MESIEKTKICTKCKIEYPATFEYFPKDIRMTDGMRTSCRKCYQKYQTEYRKKYRERSHAVDKNSTLDENWQDNIVIQKFKKLYLDDLLPIHKIYAMTKLSMSNIQFLIEELDIKISKKQRYKLVKEKKDKYFTSIRPEKGYLEDRYKEVGFSMPNLKDKYYKEIPMDVLKKWFDELGIQRRWALRFKNREQRLQNIIKQLKRKI